MSSVKRLKSGLLGLEGLGTVFLAAIQADDRFDLVAVADSNAQVVRRLAEETAARGYEDYRRLVVEEAHAGLDVLFVALEPFHSHEFVRMAARGGVAVFHKAPFARNVAEGRTLIRCFDETRRPLVVSRFWQSEPAFAKLDRMAELVGRVHLATARVRTADGPVGWRGDSVRAGGGVLLNGAYEQVDLLTALLGMPEDVYARCSAASAPPAPRKHDTEDAAILTLRFSGDRIGSVTVSNGAPEPSWSVTFVGADGRIDLGPGRLTLLAAGGASQVFNVRSKPSLAPAIGSFGSACLSGEEPFLSTASQHLVSLAVIEAGYLSARTGAPESPRQLLG